jgi:hypothetical protein
MSQADYELHKEREYEKTLDNGEDDDYLRLTFGDYTVSVFYTLSGSLEPVIQSLSIDELGVGCVDARCFSRWQLEDWESSIRKHIKAEQEQAELEARSE